MVEKGEMCLHIFFGVAGICLARGHGREAISQGRAKRGDPE
jgi:hypothetical protein